jgi:hypothetical protein
MVGDQLEDNLNPIGRLYYAGSTMICIRPRWRRKSASRSARRPARRNYARSLWQMVFRNVRRAAETPFNMILEARA